MASSDHQVIGKLVKMHNKVAFFGLPSKTVFDHPEEHVEIVKGNLEVIVLSLLSEKSMCGYDVIKEISNKYRVLVSQGTIYPLLYSLTKDGVLRAEFEKGNMRSKIYSPTEKGIKIIENKFNEAISSAEYLIHTLKKRK